jgi:hypothetical protein
MDQGLPMFDVLMEAQLTRSLEADDSLAVEVAVVEFSRISPI